MSAIALVDMGDLAPYAGRERIVEIRPYTETLWVKWDDGHEARFSWIWLRDHCACAACRHPTTRERLFELYDLSLPLAAPRVLLEPEGALQLRWQKDGQEEHVTRYDPAWLRRRAYEPAHAQNGPHEGWDASMAGRLPRFNFDEVQERGDALRNWIQALLQHGVALISGAPARPGELARFAESIAPIYETNFGRIFDVQSKPNPNNAAYTSLGLELHVDLPNHPSPPDIQLLFCIANEAEGGDSTLADGLWIAERLRKESPQDFQVLTTLPIDFRFQDAEVDIRFKTPLIELSPQGDFIGIRFNNWIRDSLLLPPEEVETFYRAYQRLWKELRDERNHIQLRLQAGDLLAFDNRRVLHGRTAFTATGARHLQGCYLQRSMVESRLRILERNAK